MLLLSVHLIGSNDSKIPLHSHFRWYRRWRCLLCQEQLTCWVWQDIMDEHQFGGLCPTPTIMTTFLGHQPSVPKLIISKPPPQAYLLQASVEFVIVLCVKG
jgi:hypothetical protein